MQFVLSKQQDNPMAVTCTDTHNKKEHKTLTKYEVIIHTSLNHINCTTKKLPSTNPCSTQVACHADHN